MSQKSTSSEVTHMLIMIGSLNWGLIGAGRLVAGADWNVLHMVFGAAPMFETSLYLIIGLAALYKVAGCSKSCCCK